MVDLHCTICYEEFNLVDRYPVVLPCGHTHICAVCVKKIEHCHVCREPLYWNPPKPQQPAINNHNSHIHRSPAAARYARYNQRYAPSTPPHPGNGTKPEKREKVPLPCPKNLVLIETIETKQRQERLVAEQKAIKQQKKLEKLREKQVRSQQRREEKENLRLRRQADTTRGSYHPALTQHCSMDSQDIEVDIDQNNNLLDNEDYDDEELDYDDEISSSSSSVLPFGDPELISGYVSLSGACGTYAVREPGGLLVLPQDPNRTKYHIMKQNGDEKKEGSQHSSAHFSSIFNDADDSYCGDDGGTNLQPPRSNKDPFTIEKGQKVQVVGILESNEQAVFQLARGAGYVVATANQLVKVGGPEEESCIMEGMLQSLLDKQQEMRRKLDEMSNLAIELKRKIVLEQEKPEKVPVIDFPIPKKSSSSGEGEPPVSPTHDGKSAGIVNVHANLGTGIYPTTPTRTSTYSHPGSPVGGSGGLDSVASQSSTVVELGTTPRTPSHTPGFYTRAHQGEFVHSPAHSCPMPTNTTTAVHLEQPFLDDEGTSSTGVLRYRVNSDDDTSGLGLAGFLGCGTSLFGERLLESSDSGGATNIFNTSNNGRRDILLSLEQNALMQQSNAQRRAAALASVAAGSPGFRAIGLLESTGSSDSPIRRGGSFDGGGGVNFRTGMSGHSGLGRPNRDFSCDQQLTYQNGEAGMLPRRREMKMSQMSNHRGAAPARLGPRTGLHSRGAAPDTLVGCQTIR